MAITRQKKESILDDLNEQFKKARMVVFVNFHGLNTAASRKLRVLLKQSRGQYQVAKKTLIRKALQKISAFGSMPDLEGEIGMIFSPAESFMDIAKNLAKFIKEHKELVVSGGILEEKLIGPKMVSELAAIPSREILLAKLVYIINAPRRGLVVTLSGAMRNFVSVLSQIRK